MHTFGLCTSDDVDARMFYVYRNGIAYPCHVQSSAAPCGKQLFYKLSVRVAVGGIEHAHNLVHQNDHASRIVVVRQHKRFGSEV